MELMEGARQGDVILVGKALAEHSFEKNVLSRALFRAIENDHMVVVAKLFEFQTFTGEILHHALILAGMKNAGASLSLFLTTGRYDPADLRLAYTAALTSNAPEAVKALLVFPKFYISDANVQAGIKSALEKDFLEVAALLQKDRKTLQNEANSSTCVLI